ncbi:sigma-E factor negative regulatory protein [Massilia sp. P8910]|uniref:sigma-E factor negative regulatory protein n=1 Tax=Massilia antarctica TaxID=2765360 RepID=UPI001E5E41D6|nr:sigma-E factor negative regulatory protein [Massilia antarctica]MCE3605315.1 sigma-E factor negative regulatory protein [Massilia antarctica]
MDTPKKVREQISAFSDHELSPSTLPDAALHSADGQHAWDLYHRIRDAMRDPGGPALSEAFASKLAARLAAEPPPGKRMLRASSAALARRAPAAVAAGAAGPVTGISEAALADAAVPVSDRDAPDALDPIAVAEPVNAAITEPRPDGLTERRDTRADGAAEGTADGTADPKLVSAAKPAIASMS